MWEIHRVYDVATLNHARSDHHVISDISWWWMNGADELLLIKCIKYRSSRLIVNTRWVRRLCLRTGEWFHEPHSIITCELKKVCSTKLLGLKMTWAGSDSWRWRWKWQPLSNMEGDSRESIVYPSRIASVLRHCGEGVEGGLLWSSAQHWISHLTDSLYHSVR